MKSLRLLFVMILLLAVVLPIGAVFVLLEKTPASVNQRTASVQDAARARRLARETLVTLFEARETSRLTFQEQDINGIISLGNRAYRELRGQATVASDGLHIDMTLRVPANPLGQFVNFELDVRPSDYGLDVARLRLGRMEISGATAKAIGETALNLALGSGEGTKLLDAIRATEFKENQFAVVVDPIPDLKSRLKKASTRLGDIRDDVALLGDPETVQVYYAKLIEIERRLQGAGKVSLANYVGPLLQHAKDRSGFTDAATENQAAILAMVIYFGDARFERLIGNVRVGALKLHRPNKSNVHLSGRRDLLLHFIISAGLKIVADRGISTAIGEFKELLDSNKGGSGFSFVDLGADRTGIHFAEVATGRHAERLQRLVAGKTDERLFFPMFKDLPEGMSAETFKARYGDVESVAYRTMVAEIDRRIASSVAYKIE